MKKNELKQVLKPLIKECIREVVFEEGLLSGTTQYKQGVTEERQLVEAQQQQKKLKQTRKKMLDAIGQNSYNGVNLFEGTEPISRAGNPSGNSSARGPLSDVDPGDPGVDIAAFFGSQARKF